MWILFNGYSFQYKTHGELVYLISYSSQKMPNANCLLVSNQFRILLNKTFESHPIDDMIK